MSQDKFSQFKIDDFENTKKDALIELARSAEAAERYEDMTEFMKARVTRFPNDKLDQEERNLLSVAYKNVIGSRRASWRGTQEQEDNESGDFLENLGDYAKKYRTVLESELKTISNDVLGLLEDHLCSKDDELDWMRDAEGTVPAPDGKNLTKFTLPTPPGKDDKDRQENPAEAEVFYLKMAGDYYRYLTESVGGDENTKHTEEKYAKALSIAEVYLASTHPIRLGLALNYSVCYYEILNERTKACDLAKSAFDLAISKLDELDEADYKDSTLIMQLLRDNLTLWTSDENNEEQ